MATNVVTVPFTEGLQWFIDAIKTFFRHPKQQAAWGFLFCVVGLLGGLPPKPVPIVLLILQPLFMVWIIANLAAVDRGERASLMRPIAISDLPWQRLLAWGLAFTLIILLVGILAMALVKLDKSVVSVIVIPLVLVMLVFTLASVFAPFLITWRGESIRSAPWLSFRGCLHNLGSLLLNAFFLGLLALFQYVITYLFPEGMKLTEPSATPIFFLFLLVSLAVNACVSVVYLNNACYAFQAIFPEEE